MDKYDVIIIGAGLSGLTCGLYLQEAGLKTLILERRPQAGGLTSSWKIHDRDIPDVINAEDAILQYPMHMIFSEKYPNLLDIYEHLGISKNLTSPIKEFNIIDSTYTKHHFKMEDSWLPAPLHGIKTILNLKMSIVDKLSFVLAGLGMLYLGNSLNCEKPKDSFFDQISFEAFLKRMFATKRARDFMGSLVPSIYNLDSIEVNARRMASIIFGTLFMSKRGMWYQLVNDNYTTGVIEPHVARFIKAGGTLKLNCDVHKIVCDHNVVNYILYQDFNKDYTRDIICPVCKSEQKLENKFCKNCGLDFNNRTADTVPIEKVSAKYYVAGVRGHQLVPLIDKNSSFLSDPYFQNLGREKGACLSVARIFYDKKITNERFITGTSRTGFCFNGCQDIGNIMPRYAKYPGSVIDVLSDRAESIQIKSVDLYLKDVIEDLKKVYPLAKTANVIFASGAHIQPPVLYHKEVPHLPGERNRFVDTPLQNLFAGNCSLGRIGIGMESAYQAGKMAANRILSKEGKKPIITYGVLKYKVSFLTRMTYNIINVLAKIKNLFGKIITSI